MKALQDLDSGVSEWGWEQNGCGLKSALMLWPAPCAEIQRGRDCPAEMIKVQFSCGPGPLSTRTVALSEKEEQKHRCCPVLNTVDLRTQGP